MFFSFKSFLVDFFSPSLFEFIISFRSLDDGHFVPMASDVEAVRRVGCNMILRFAGFAKEANWKPVLSSHGLSLRKQFFLGRSHRSVLSSQSKFAQF